MTDDEQRLQEITDMLLLVRDNLFRGMSKSIQKLQAESINEVLGLPKFVGSSKKSERSVKSELGYSRIGLDNV